MRIGYLLQDSLALSSGITRKIVDQCTIWSNEQHAVFVSCLRRADDSNHLQPNPFSPSVGFHQTPYIRPGAQSVIASYRVASAMLSFEPDLVYMRASWPFPAWSDLCGRVPTLIELNGPIAGDKFGEKLAAPMIRRLLRKSAGVVAVTPEIGASVSGFGIPVSVVSNGIRLSEYSPLPVSREPNVNIAFLGSHDFPFNGIDLLAQIAERRPEWRFHVIGPIASSSDRATNNITFHGYLERREYEAILTGCHAAFGTLALFRRGLTEATSLKAREYMAYGLPFVLGHRDPDIDDQGKVDWVLGCDLKGGVSDAFLDALSVFVERWRERRIPRSEVMFVDQHRKERQRLALFEAVVRRNQPKAPSQE